MDQPLPEPVTLSRVAREAGVSLATASRAINGSATRTVRPDLRHRVQEAAQRLGYSPNPNAQAMAHGRTTAVGLIVHDIADPYFSSLAAGVTAAAEQQGLVVTLASTQHDYQRERVFVELMRRQRARAIILAGGRLDSHGADQPVVDTLVAYRSEGGGVALISQPLYDLPTVVLGNRAGAAQLAETLLGLDYSTFGLLAGPERHLTARERSEGFVDALAERGSAVESAHVVTGAFTRDGGYDGMTAMLSRPSRPRLVFAVNDVMAVGAMAAVRDAGLRVPDDIAVAGFDDIVTLRDVSPALTTVRMPLTRIGELATTLALDPFASGGSSRRVAVSGEVVVRASTPAQRHRR